MRLTTPAEYRAVLRTRPVGQGKILLLHYASHLQTPDNPICPKLGLITPKRILRLAVDRNRVKRVLRESFRHQQNNLPAGSYVFRLKTIPQSVDRSQLKRLVRHEADKLLGRLKTRQHDALVTN